LLLQHAGDLTDEQAVEQTAFVPWHLIPSIAANIL
jgi:hypothetical protein